MIITQSYFYYINLYSIKASGSEWKRGSPSCFQTVLKYHYKEEPMLSFICFIFCIVHCSGIFGGAYLHQDHPYFVVVGVSTFQTNYCGGTVVEADFVITAAHCLFDFTFQDWARDSSIRVFQSNFKHHSWP